MIGLNNKKSQIGATITWMVAVIIIFFIMLIYILAVMAMASLKGVSKDVTQKIVSENMAENEELISILYTKVDGTETILEELKGYALLQQTPEAAQKKIKIQSDITKTLLTICGDSYFQFLDIRVDTRNLEVDSAFAVDFGPLISYKLLFKNKVFEIKYMKANNC